jgi:choline-sulfatase
MVPYRKGTVTVMKSVVKRPNILLIMVDQMAWNVIHGFGHPAVKTPNLDLLVREGVSFVNTYCNSPICVSSRAAFMTGKLVRHTNAFDNGSELPASIPTFVHHLNRAGYQTILAGKMHFVGPDQLHGFQTRLTTDISPVGLELTPDWTRGAYPNEGTSVNRLRYPPVRDWSLQLSYDEEVLHSTLVHLRQLRMGSEPFFLCASFSHPHDPFLVTEHFWRLYDEVDIPLPTAPARALSEHHPYNQWIQIHHETDRSPLSDGETLQARRAYYGMVSYTDSLVGRILEELERLSFEDTVVVFTSDHGEMLGEHGMWFKRTFFDGATKVPLIVHAPNRYSPAQRSEVVSMADLTATLIDLAKVPEKDAWLSDLDGDSFLALLEGGNAPWKNVALSEYYAEGTLQPMLMLRKGQYKYVFVHEHAPLLFDLEADPLELRDLSSDPAHAETCRELEHALLAGLDVEALRHKILQSQRERLMIASSTPTGSLWRFEAKRDAARLYRRATS